MPPEEPQQGEEHSREKTLSQELCKQFCLIQTKVDCLQNWRKAATIERNISLVRIVEGFKLCQLSEIIQFFHRMRFSVGRTIYCYCGTCLFLSEQVRQLNKKLFVFTIPFFTIKKGTHRGHRCGISKWQKVIPSGQSGIKRTEGKHILAHSFTTDSLSMGPLENHRCLLNGRRKLACPWTPLHRKTTHLLRRVQN